MNRSHSFSHAFSVAELIVVIGVVLILAAAALQANGGIQGLLRFNNVFQQTISIAQRARTLATTNTEYSFGVEIDINERAVKLFRKKDGVSETLESFTAPETVHFDALNGDAECATPTVFEFSALAGEVSFTCANAPTALTVRFCQVLRGEKNKRCGDSPVRSRTFVLHKTSGVPQVK